MLIDEANGFVYVLNCKVGAKVVEFASRGGMGSR